MVMTNVCVLVEDVIVSIVMSVTGDSFETPNQRTNENDRLVKYRPAYLRHCNGTEVSKSYLRSTVY